MMSVRQIDPPGRPKSTKVGDTPGGTREGYRERWREPETDRTVREWYPGLVVIRRSAARKTLKNIAK